MCVGPAYEYPDGEEYLPCPRCGCCDLTPYCDGSGLGNCSGLCDENGSHAWDTPTARLIDVA